VLTVLSVIGTRPEAIKMAPVVSELGRCADRVRSRVCVTSQHREMLDQVLHLFDIRPDYDLDLMRADQALAELTANLFTGLDPIVAATRPDWVLAQGDTTTVLVAALVAFYRRIPFGHVEAGLRTGDLARPFPEEMNRRVADTVAGLLFAPTERARQALLAEGAAADDILVTGNTVIDALLTVAARPYDWRRGPLAGLPREARLVVVTAHRRESFGAPFRALCQAIRDLARQFAPGVHIVYPVHLNPNVRAPVTEILGRIDNVHLLDPLDYESMVHLMNRATLILTDSGGIQEEAPSLGVPVLVLRDVTERPEAVEAGVVRVVGTAREPIVAAARRLLTDAAAHQAMATRVNPYGDGKAAARIVAALLERGGRRRPVRPS
jgi:UDP-N-acetylglucosamine 2-epimerase